jgi:hypothetical protein
MVRPYTHAHRIKGAYILAVKRFFLPFHQLSSLSSLSSLVSILFSLTGTFFFFFLTISSSCFSFTLTITQNKLTSLFLFYIPTQNLQTHTKKPRSREQTRKETKFYLSSFEFGMVYLKQV